MVTRLEPQHLGSRLLVDRLLLPGVPQPDEALLVPRRQQVWPGVQQPAQRVLVTVRKGADVLAWQCDIMLHSHKGE